MDKEIIYSFKEYQEKYNTLLDKFFLENEEIEEIDFIDDEIKNYKICFKLVNFPIDKIFNTFWRIEYGINLKTFSVPQEAYDFIFANENNYYYYKIYNDIVKPSGVLIAYTDVEKKIKQIRLMFPKIISFLETKKSELETNSQSIMKAGDTLNWQGTTLQFTELTKALFETKLISPTLTQKEFFKKMELFFNIDEFDEKEKLKGIRARSKDLTPFINTLETSLNNWIKNKD